MRDAIDNIWSEANKEQAEARMKRDKPTELKEFADSMMHVVKPMFEQFRLQTEFNQLQLSLAMKAFCGAANSLTALGISKEAQNTIMQAMLDISQNVEIEAGCKPTKLLFRLKNEK